MRTHQNFNFIRRLGWVAIALSAFMFSPMATASLIGDEIKISDASGSNATLCTVGTNCDGLSGWGFDMLSVSANSIFIDVSQQLDGFTIKFSDLDWTDMLGGILLDVDLSFTGIFASIGEPSVFDINDHGFTVTYFHQVPDQGETITFDLITNHSVPEPSIIALFALGLVGLGFARRRKA
jgi:hypothetical protein